MRLRELRLQKNLLQKEVAAALGLERSKYVKYETEKVEPSIEVLIQMADYFRVSLDELIGRYQDPASPSLTATEKSLVQSFRSLSQEGKDYIAQQMAIASHIYKQHNNYERVESQAYIE